MWYFYGIVLSITSITLSVFFSELPIDLRLVLNDALFRFHGTGFWALLQVYFSISLLFLVCLLWAHVTETHSEYFSLCFLQFASVTASYRNCRSKLQIKTIFKNMFHKSSSKLTCKLICIFFRVLCLLAFVPDMTWIMSPSTIKSLIDS